MSTRSITRRLGIRGSGAGGYTLFELLIVVALLAVIASIALPGFLHTVRKSPLRQAMSDLQEACHRARMMAIMRGTRSELVINAVDGSLTVRPVQETAVAPTDTVPGGLPASPADSATASGTRAEPRDGLGPTTVKLPESVVFKKLVVNLQDLMDSTEARVRFYSNSTCDAFTATLLSEQNEERTLTLEITTAREEMEVVR